ncbi:MAG: DUF5118 domain-containing protein, partial [Marinirhabdus sp.]|nr:DUF5118 domain-containing protein [Marinirhabdus sp.]
MRYLCIVLFFFGSFMGNAQFLEKKENLETFNGFYTFHYSEKEGEIYLEVPKNRLEEEFLYVHS